MKLVISDGKLAVSMVAPDTLYELPVESIIEEFLRPAITHLKREHEAAKERDADQRAQDFAAMMKRLVLQ